MSGIEIVRGADGPVEIRLRGFLTAAERRTRRWRSAFQWTLIGLAFLMALGLGGLTLRWDYQSQRELRVLLLDLRQTRIEAGCWRFAALYLPESRADGLTRERRAISCIEQRVKGEIK